MNGEAPPEQTQGQKGYPSSSRQRTALEPLSPAVERLTRPPGRAYSTGKPPLDEAIASLTAAAEAVYADLLADLLTTSVRLARGRADRGELKLASAALREFARSFRLFSRYRDRPKVSIFGSARTEVGDNAYRITASFARSIVERGWMVITGAGPGIMAAGNEGAGAAASFGANIYLPGYNQTNIFVANNTKLITFRYFFTRKVAFVKESDAFVFLPGGYGTLDEAFELLTLMQTGKTAPRPVVLLEPPGSAYWDEWQDFLRDHLVSRGFIDTDDLALFRVTDSAEGALAEIERFYANYHSMRFVDDTLYLRLRTAPGDAALADIRRDFADLLAKGTFEVVQPAPVEVEEGDTLTHQRLAFRPAHNYPRLRLLIDALNRIV